MIPSKLDPKPDFDWCPYAFASATGFAFALADLWSLVYSLFLMRIEGRTAANDLADDFKFGSRFR